LAPPDEGRHLRRKVAFVGTGHRAELFFSALLGDHAADAVPVALCDTNPGRLAYYQRLWQSVHPGVELATYELDPGHPVAFEQMLDREQPDVVLVATVDATHAHYVASALHRGVDVICEKPLTTSVDGCRQIAEAARNSDADLTVTFNYRYSPRNAKVKELLASGAIGAVTSVHFEWTLDTVHGADYFRRWHRHRDTSGGLLVHKATHHFDLVNWWLDDRPRTVSAHSSLRFYGADNARSRGLGERPARSLDAFAADAKHDDPFAFNLAADERLSQLYLDNERYDGYVRDGDPFAPDISIDDNMAVLADYCNGALLTYSLHAHAPWEGYRVALNGTEGRLELDVVERGATAPQGADDAVETGVRRVGSRLTLQRHWGPAEHVALDVGQQRPGADGRDPAGSDPAGNDTADRDGVHGHGGGDALLLADLFGAPTPDPLGQQADYIDGLHSVLTGLAANKAAATGKPVPLDELGAGIINSVPASGATGAPS
jgi:predicted dehydrogenase